MKLLSLGHSCFVLEMTPAKATESVRILADPWLSDYLIGDLQGRFPRCRFDAKALEPLHGIFISHSHTDHLDPYSLVRLWRELSQRPTLILPQSVSYLEQVFRDTLDNVTIQFLEDRTPVGFHGIEVMGFFNPETAATNEDDVMVLVARNEDEVFLSESDALLPLYHPEARAMVSELLDLDSAQTVCFLTTKNEGGATMAMLAARDLDDRRQRLARSIDATYEEVYELYSAVDLEPSEDLWQSDRLVRLIGGQGICFPQRLESDWNRVLFPIRLEDRVRMERQVAAETECQHAIEEFLPGHIYHLSQGRLAKREVCGFVDLLDDEEERRFNPDLEIFEHFPLAPLVEESRPVDQQKQRLLDCLNHRFLPHLVGARNPPVEHLLSQSHGRYRIRIRYGTSADHEDLDYQLTFKRLTFESVQNDGEPDEFYWANDLEDFLDGRCDEFSTFCRHPLGGKAQRLWLCLGLPYLNNDLIERKLRWHFERAAAGESLEEWVLSFYRFMEDQGAG